MQILLLTASLVLKRNITKTVHLVLGNSLGTLLAQLIRKSVIAHEGFVSNDIARVLAHDLSKESYLDSELDGENESAGASTEIDMPKPETKFEMPKTFDSHVITKETEAEAKVDHVAKIKCLPFDPEFKQKLLSRATTEVAKRQLDCEIKNCRTSFKLKERDVSDKMLSEEERSDVSTKLTCGMNDVSVSNKIKLEEEKKDASDATKLVNENNLENKNSTDLPIIFCATMNAAIKSPAILNVTLNLEAPGTITGRWRTFCLIKNFHDFSHLSIQNRIHSKIVGREKFHSRQYFS